VSHTLIKTRQFNINDTTALIDIPISEWDRVSIQLSDPTSVLGTAVIEFKVGVDGETFNSLATPATFTSITTTHWQEAIDVQSVSHGRILVTTPEGTDESVYFSVFAYNIKA